MTFFLQPFFKIVLVGAIAASFLMVFPTANAQPSLEEQIQYLKQQVNNLQQHILSSGTVTQELSTTDNTHLRFTRNLSYGDRGDDVQNLQKVLNKALFQPIAQSGPGSPGQETNFFGPKTQAAVERFQTAYFKEVLAPAGLKEATGYVGLYTRSKLNALLANNEINVNTGAGQVDSYENTDNASNNFSGDSELSQLESEIIFDKWDLTENEKYRIVQSVPSELRGEYFPEYSNTEQENTNYESENQLRLEYERRLEQQSSAIERLKKLVFLEHFKNPISFIETSLAAVLGTPMKANAQAFLVFGGRITAIVPCTCNPPAIQVIVVGARPATSVYFPGITQKSPPTPPAPGAATIGNYTQFGVCLTGAPPACVPTPAFGTILIMGTSY